MFKSLQARAFACFVLWSAWLPVAPAQVSVLTYHNDSSRTGQNVNETLLTRTNVKSSSFAKLFSYPVDGYVVAQPLYVPNVAIPGLGIHNVVYVATQHDSVFAFDADGGSGTAPLWQVSFINPSANVTTVPINQQGCNGVTEFNEVGIIGTPTIDLTTNTLYVVAKTKEVAGRSTYPQRLHALDITTGAEKFGGPVTITGTVPLSNGSLLTFSSLPQCQRPGLLLSNGVIYVAFGSNGCDLKATGWLFAYDATTLAQLGIFNTAPNDPYGGNLWQGGSGPAADSAGNLYMATANGAFDGNSGGNDFGDSVLKVALANNALSMVDYFTPYDQLNMSSQDLDLGSGGVLLLPDQPGTSPHLLVAAGKTGTVYLVDRDQLGQYNPVSDVQIVQSIPGAVGQQFGGSVYWNNTVYFAAQKDTLKGFSLSNGLLSETPSVVAQKYPMVGVPSISANGTTNGIVWMVRSPASPILSAFDAGTLQEIYNTNQVSSRDFLGSINHFVTPTIANGKVYVGTLTQLVAYGLIPQLLVSAGNNQSAPAGTVLPAVLSVQAVDPYTQNPLAGVTVTFSDGNAGGTFSNPVGTTDSTGTVSTNYTVPTIVKTVTISATSPNYAATSFSAIATAGPPKTIALVSGGAQTGPVGSTLPAALVVKLKDAYGNVVPGQAVTFSDGTANGSFSANPVTTTSLGQASVSFTLPTKPGSATITATSGAVTVTFSEKATVGSPVTMAVVSGNNQSAPPNTQLHSALVVLITDQYNNPVSGVTVGFADGGSGGIFSASSANTNSNGRASTMYTTSGSSGAVIVTATATGLPSAQFNVTVQ